MPRPPPGPPLTGIPLTRRVQNLAPANRSRSRSRGRGGGGYGGGGGGYRGGSPERMKRVSLLVRNLAFDTRCVCL
jgi:hypothetical protein